MILALKEHFIICRQALSCAKGQTENLISLTFAQTRQPLPEEIMENKGRRNVSVSQGKSSSS